MLKRLLNIVTHQIHTLPVLVLMPHSRCNCRCVMCDIWKANHEKTEISVEELEKHLPAFKRLKVRRVALSGGEALMHSNLWRFCQLLREANIKISLLSTGITVKGHAGEIVSHCDDLIVSLDGDREIHNLIRNLPSAFEKLEGGVKAVKALDPSFRVTGRTVLQKMNFRRFPFIIRTAKALGLDQISFLAADVSSQAFNRPLGWDHERAREVALDEDEVRELELLMRQTFKDLKSEWDKKFVAESPEKLLDICRYYAAMQGGQFPLKKCNAPWMSAVIESNGDVLPCFFHKPYGNINDNGVLEIINSQKATSFRRNLDINKDPTCQKCVCSLHVGIMQEV